MDESQLLLAPANYSKNRALFERTQALIGEVCSSVAIRLDNEHTDYRTKGSFSPWTVFPNLGALDGHTAFLMGLYNLRGDDMREIRALLLRKNYEYGNSVVEPLSVFSRLSPRERIGVRMDDKISRVKQIAKMDADDVAVKEDTAKDFVGYLILDLVLEALENERRIPRAIRAMVSP